MAGTSSIGTMQGAENKTIDFSFDLKSVNLLLISILTSATAEAYFTLFVAMHSGKFSRCVYSHLFEADVPTREVCMWSNRL
jgi:hypothetical protein